MPILPFSSQRRSSNEWVQQFQQIASDSISAAEEMLAALGGQQEEALARIVAIEHRADGAVRKVHSLLDKTFIAPYDKRDIVLLTHRLDDIVDTIRTAARFLVNYRAMEAQNGEGLIGIAESMCRLILRSTHKLKEIVDQMPKFDHSRLREAIEAVSVIEDEADDLFAQAIRKVFPDPNQPLTAATLAWRDIFRLLERTTDHCGHAMGVILSIARQEGS